MTDERLAVIRDRVRIIQARGGILRPDEPHLLARWCAELVEEIDRLRPTQPVLPLTESCEPQGV